MFGRIKNFFSRRKKQKEYKQFITSLKQGYNFLKWIEKQLPNRKVRKLFLKDLIKHGVVNNKTLEELFNKYKKY